MRAKLAALLVGLGTVYFGGTTYRLVGPAEGVRIVDLRDAGLAGLCSPALLECQVRIADACRLRPDGGLRLKYGTVEDPVFVCPSSGDDLIVANWPTFTTDAGRERPCFEPAGPIEDACRFTDACNDGGTACQAPTRFSNDRCACRGATGACRIPNPDGGVGIAQPFGTTIGPGATGAGCVRKACQELNGDQGESWPTAECPP